MPVELSFCVVNTEQRGLLRYCLDAIARERATVDFETEVLVLDNASQDGSVDVARRHPVTTEVIALPERRGKAANDCLLLQRAQGRFCLLLNEDSELEPGATVALHAALAADERAGAAGAMLVRPDGEQQPSAWRFPSARHRAADRAVAAQALRRAEHAASAVRPVDWVQSAAMLVRREAAERRSATSTPSSSSTPTRSTSAAAWPDAGWHTLYVPAARAVHHEQLSTGSVPSRRIVEFSRNRDRYMRKHHSRLSACARALPDGLDVRPAGGRRARAPRPQPQALLQARHATLFPRRGEGPAPRPPRSSTGG